MKLTVFIMFATTLTLLANTTDAQNSIISFNTEKLSVGQFIELIEEKTDFLVVYSNREIDINREVNLSKREDKVSSFLSEVFGGVGIDYEFDRKYIILAKEKLARDNLALGYQQAQNLVNGTVTDNSGNKLIGVHVTVKGTTIGALTDIEGRYLINVPTSSAILQFSFIGYTTQEVTVGDRREINITLAEDVRMLEEIVVVGYGTQKKLNLTAAVDQVTSETLDNRPIPNLTQGLQGVMPNLNIKLLDGKPTAAPSFNIRGTTSISVDGGVSALVLIDGVEGDPSLLNPADIASISMLKDAASASIYGARGAFGVVLITTKNPEKGKTSITFSSNYAIKQPIGVPDFVTDGYTYVRMFVDAFINGDGSFPQNINKTLKVSQAYLDAFKAKVESGQPYNEIEIDPVTGEYVYYGSTDFYSHLYKKNLGASDNNLSVTGSGEKTTYLISGRSLKQDGLFRYNTDDYSMKNLRAKGGIQVFPWLRIDNNTDYSEMSYHNPMNVGEGSGIWRNIGDEGHPNGTMFNPDGSLTMVSVYNVGDMWYGRNGIDTRKRVIKNTSGFTSEFLDRKLRVKGDFTFSYTNNDVARKRVQVPYSNKPDVIAYVGTTTNDLQADKRVTQYLATNLFSEYENNFGEDHYLKLLVGYNYEESTYNRLLTQRNGIIYEDATDLNLALGQSIVTGGGYEKWAILGGFSRINYSFRDRYLIELNARYDGSSKFPAGQRYALFPSVSAGWRLSKEPFFNVSPRLISDIKLRASYGSLGNGNVASYIYQEQLSVSQSAQILNGVRPQKTSRPSVIPDGITWETSTTTDFGLDFSMLSDRLLFVGDIYQRNTTDMFTIGLTLPAIFGATAPKGNYADLVTKGWEISLTWRDKFDIAAKPANYSVRFTLADYTSKVTRYNNPDKLLSDYYEGQVLGEIWGYVTEGFFIDEEDVATHAKQSPQMRASPTNLWFPGDIKLADLNGDGFVNIGTNRVSDPGDRKIIGNSQAHYTFSTTIGLDWNNFFFTSFFQGVGKQQWYPSPEAEIFWGQYNRPYNNVPIFHLGNMWTPDNTGAYFPRTMSRAASNNTSRELGVAQTGYLQNIAYIRLKSVQLGYNLPQSLISRIGAQALRVYVSGENLWTWSPLYKLVGRGHIDVENTGPSDQLFSSSNAGDGYNYPMLSSFSLGLSVSF